MDQDITAADALALDRINTQIYRDDVASSTKAFKRDIAARLTEKYFTTNTATTPDTIAKDAREDAARYKAALLEAFKVVDSLGL